MEGQSKNAATQQNGIRRARVRGGKKGLKLEGEKPIDPQNYGQVPLSRLVGAHIDWMMVHCVGRSQRFRAKKCKCRYRPLEALERKELLIFFRQKSDDSISRYKRRGREEQERESAGCLGPLIGRPSHYGRGHTHGQGPIATAHRRGHAFFVECTGTRLISPSSGI